MNNKPIAARRATFMLLRPMVRILIRSGISFAQFSALAKQMYVAVATSDYGLRGRPTNVSRVALLTGLTRRDVRQQRENLKQDGGLANGRETNLTRVLHHWHCDDRYSSRSGKPLRLSINGEQRSFDSLYREYGGGDVPCTAALKELIASGTVIRHPDDTVEPLRDFFVPGEIDAAAIERAGEILADVGNSVAHNLLNDSGALPRFEGSAVTHFLPAGKLPAYRAFLEEQGRKFLEGADAWLAQHVSETTTRRRVGVGVYQIQSEEEHPD